MRDELELEKLVGGPGFEPGASRSRSGTTVSFRIRRFLACLLYSIARLVVSSRVLPCPPGSGIAWHSCDLRM